MNPLKWIRWKVVVVFGVVIFGALYFLGLNPLARKGINELGSSGQAGARFSIAKVALGILTGQSDFDDFKMATPRKVPPEEEPKQQVASAEKIVFDLGVADILRKRFTVDELTITRPLLRIERREDGTINVGEIGASEEEIEKEKSEKTEKKPTDWVKSIEEWIERIRKRMEEREKKEKEEPQVAKKEGWRPDYSRQITYPFEKNYRVLARKVSAEALEIRFEDDAGKLKPPPIKNGKIEITNLSDRPEYFQDAPIGISVSGEIANSPIKISGILDLRRTETGKKNLINLTVSATNVDLKKVVEAFAGPSLDVSFEKGTADLNAEIRLIDLENLRIAGVAADRPLLALRGVELKAKPGAEIAGLPAEKFATALNNVGELEANPEITGTLTNPKVNWGETIKEFIASGGKAYAKKQINRGIEKGTREAQDLLNKEVGEKAPELKKGLQDVIPGGEKEIEKKAGGLLKGIFGEDKSK